MNALMCPADPRTTMSAPFSEIPQRADASPSTITSPPRPVAATAWLALPVTRTTPDMMFSARPTPALPWTVTVAGVAHDLDLDRRVQPAGERVRAGRVQDLPVADRLSRPGLVVQPLVEVAQGGRRQVDPLHGAGRGAHAATPSRSHEYTVAGSGSQMRASSAPGSVAIARYSEAIATHSSVSASTAGLQAIGSRSTAKPSAVPTAKV